MTDHGVAAPGRARAAGRARRAGAARTGSSSSRRCVQCPVLCGRIASSLTSSRSSVVSNSSTASTPVTPRPSAIVVGDLGRRRRRLARPTTAPARSPRRTPRRAARSRPPARPRSPPTGGARPSCASSRRKSTSSSTSRAPPLASSARSANQSSASCASRPRARPCRRSRRAAVLTHGRGRRDRRGTRRARRRSRTARPVRHRNAELGQPLPHQQLVLRVEQRIRPRTHRRRPRATSSRSTACGTCSWSKVTTSTPCAKASTSSRVAEVADRRGGQRRADSPSVSAKTRKSMPEVDRRGNHHPGELAAADHADDHSCSSLFVPRPGKTLLGDRMRQVRCG